jgi:hypothetical protein
LTHVLPPIIDPAVKDPDFWRVCFGHIQDNRLHRGNTFTRMNATSTGNMPGYYVQVKPCHCRPGLYFTKLGLAQEARKSITGAQAHVLHIQNLNRRLSSIMLTYVRDMRNLWQAKFSFRSDHGAIYHRKNRMYTDLVGEG